HNFCSRGNRFALVNYENDWQRCCDIRSLRVMYKRNGHSTEGEVNTESTLESKDLTKPQQRLVKLLRLGRSRDLIAQSLHLDEMDLQCLVAQTAEALGLPPEDPDEEYVQLQRYACQLSVSASRKKAALAVDPDRLEKLIENGVLRLWK